MDEDDEDNLDRWQIR